MPHDDRAPGFAALVAAEATGTPSFRVEPAPEAAFAAPNPGAA